MFAVVVKVIWLVCSAIWSALMLVLFAYSFLARTEHWITLSFGAGFSSVIWWILTIHLFTNVKLFRPNSEGAIDVLLKGSPLLSQVIGVILLISSTLMIPMIALAMIWDFIASSDNTPLWFGRQFLVVGATFAWASGMVIQIKRADHSRAAE
jgi:hypothetical protein